MATAPRATDRKGEMMSTELEHKILQPRAQHAADAGFSVRLNHAEWNAILEALRAAPGAEPEISRFHQPCPLHLHTPLTLRTTASAGFTMGVCMVCHPESPAGQGATAGCECPTCGAPCIDETEDSGGFGDAYKFTYLAPAHGEREDEILVHRIGVTRTRLESRCNATEHFAIGRYFAEEILAIFNDCEKALASPAKQPEGGERRKAERRFWIDSRGKPFEHRKSDRRAALPAAAVLEGKS